MKVNGNMMVKKLKEERTEEDMKKFKMEKDWLEDNNNKHMYKHKLISAL